MGYQSLSSVTGHFCFAPTDKMIYACMNFPGLFHGSQVCTGFGLFWNIGRYKICVDEGFPRSGDMIDKFVGPMSQRTRDNFAPVMRRVILQRHNMYVSLRQSREWGMRALQGFRD